MKYLAIPNDRNKILVEIEKRGWQAEALDEDDLDWWLDEVYRLTPLGDREGRSAYLLLKVDPLCDLERAKGEQVWSVSVCEEIPDHYQRARDFVVAGRLDSDLPGLIEELEFIRKRG
ncbi:MAG: hypothetical protein J5I65_18190 [Aridibacter famidurans]|nr:hypothetical protein [Aridibacter famidurans]